MKRSPLTSLAKANEIIDGRLKQGSLGSKWDDKLHEPMETSWFNVRRKTADAIQSGMSVRDVSRRYHVSIGFVSKWGRVGLAKKNLDETYPRRGKAPYGKVYSSISNRPKTIEPVISEEVRNKIEEIRNKYPFYGSRKIRKTLIDEGLDAPCNRSIDKILRQKGLLGPIKHRSAKKNYGSFEHERSMELIQIDYKDWFIDSNGELVCSIWALDDCSRAILGARISNRHSADDVIDLLSDVISFYKCKPSIVLSDHGTEFYSVEAREGAVWTAGARPTA